MDKVELRRALGSIIGKLANLQSDIQNKRRSHDWPGEVENVIWDVKKLSSQVEREMD